MAYTTQISLQMVTDIDGAARNVPNTTYVITHAAKGMIMGNLVTSDTAAVIPQGGVVPYYGFFSNLSATATEYIDILNDTAVLSRLQPGECALISISQVGTPASNLKAKAYTGKTPTLSYFIIPA